LSGSQGINQTSSINALTAVPNLFHKTVMKRNCLDKSRRDSVATDVSKWIVEFCELESTMRKDLPALLSFNTNDSVHLRRSYATLDFTVSAQGKEVHAVM
jgi:hypothetical protein